MHLRIINLLVKELIHFGRDKLLMVFIFLAPALQLVLLAQSIERGINQQPLAVLDLDHSRLSRQLVSSLDNSEELRVQFHVANNEEVRSLLDQGQARLAVIIPAGFGQELSSIDSPQCIQVIADATSTMAASVTTNAVAGVVGRFAAGQAAARGLVTPEFIDFRTNVQFNPTMDVRNSSIPAQLGFITYQVTLAVAALGLARERELGTLEQLMVTPLRRFELTIGKGLPAVAIGVLNFGVMLIVGRTIFDTPLNGSVLLLVILTLLFALAVVGAGLLISAISRTQQQAILLVFIVAIAEMAFSGFMVPVKNMPALMQTLSRVSPLQHFLAIIRGVMLRGAGVGALWVHVVALAVLSLAFWLLALRVVARRLE
jgi:ABC-2 type transport system permease protein